MTLEDMLREGRELEELSEEYKRTHPNNEAPEGVEQFVWDYWCDKCNSQY